MDDVDIFKVKENKKVSTPFGEVSLRLEHLKNVK